MRRFFTRRNLGYAFFLLIFTLVVLEFVARWYMGSVLQKSSQRKFQFDSYRIYAHVPGFQESDERGPRLSINSQGFRRTTEVAQPKPAGTYRVFFMGGSAAHGISSGNPFPISHVRDDETIDSRLERLLTARFPGKKIEVINAAVTGYKVFQHTSYLMTELLNYDPDLVIFFDGYNDHFKYNVQEDPYRDNIYQYWKPRLQHPTLGGVFDHLMLWASNFSGLARGYFAWQNNNDAAQWEAQVQEPVQGWTEDQMVAGYRSTSKRQYLRSVANNLLILKDRSVQVVLCLQSGLRFREASLLSPTEVTVLPIAHDEYKTALYPYIVHDLDSVAQQYGAHFVNVNSTLNDPTLKGQQLFLDYCHLTPLGSDLAARTIMPAVVPLIEAPDSIGTPHTNTP